MGFFDSLKKAGEGVVNHLEKEVEKNKNLYEKWSSASDDEVIRRYQNNYSSNEKLVLAKIIKERNIQHLLKK